MMSTDSRKPYREEILNFIWCKEETQQKFDSAIYHFPQRGKFVIFQWPTEKSDIHRKMLTEVTCYRRNVYFIFFSILKIIVVNIS
jgi:hypothetical protein